MNAGQYRVQLNKFIIPDFLDLESRDDEDGKSKAEEPSKNCLCNGPSCICCVDFNMTLIDLGGPGCVRLKYISPEDGIALNVSYGDNLLHSQTVKGPDPAPTCLKIFTTLAQMCARFSELLPTDDGLRGCLKLEPMLLGEVQVELPLGCFRMGPNGMKVIESSREVIKEQQPHNDEVTEKNVKETLSTNTLTSVNQTENAISTVDIEDIDDDEDEDDTIGGLSTKDIIAAVNKSAEEGIAMITNWLGFAINSTIAEANKEDEPETTAVPQVTTEVSKATS